MRSRTSLVTAAFLLLALPFPFLAAPSARAASPEDDPAVPAILSRAEALFQPMKARDYPATLKLYLEDGGWKAGLVEPFWAR